MAYVIVERHFESSVTLGDLLNLSKEQTGCLDDWNSKWIVSYLSLDHKCLFCHFEAPDADSVRSALLQAGDKNNAIVKSVSHHLGENELAINTVVKRVFDEPASIEELQQLEDDNISCLELHQVKFVKSFFSLDKRYMLCFYNAPDAESVRITQNTSKLPYEDVWACKELTADSFSSI